MVVSKNNEVKKSGKEEESKEEEEINYIMLSNMFFFVLGVASFDAYQILCEFNELQPKDNFSSEQVYSRV